RASILLAGQHTLVIHGQHSWSAVLHCAWTSRESLSGTSNEDRLWDLSCVCSLVQRALDSLAQQQLISTWTWTGLGKHHTRFGACNSGGCESSRRCGKSLVMLPKQTTPIPVPQYMLVLHLSESHSSALRLPQCFVYSQPPLTCSWCTPNTTPLLQQGGICYAFMISVSVVYNPADQQTKTPVHALLQEAFANSTRYRQSWPSRHCPDQPRQSLVSASTAESTYERRHTRLQYLVPHQVLSGIKPSPSVCLVLPGRRKWFLRMYFVHFAFLRINAPYRWLTG
ncbi:hypothetical protein D6D28_08718, partial [Aureobasidium pullulans]